MFAPDTATALSLERMVDSLSCMRIPVMRDSVEALRRLREKEDDVAARDISGIILRDPLFTLNVLRHLQEKSRDSRTMEITTISHAVMMLGVVPFLRLFQDMDVVEEALDERLHAVEGFMGVVSRSFHAALYARDWAALRHDIESDEVIIAALLHDVAEMLLWWIRPESMTQIAEAMARDKTLRSAVAQERVLGFRIIDLQRALVEKWRLPRLLQALMDDEHSQFPRARLVALAVALARHSSSGWDNAFLSEDIAAVQQLLGLSRAEVMQRIWKVALSAARGIACYSDVAPAAWLPPVPALWIGDGWAAGGDVSAESPTVADRVAELLEQHPLRSVELLELLALSFHAMRYGHGLERMVFLAVEQDRARAVARYVSGSNETSAWRRLWVDLASEESAALIERMQEGIWFHASERHPALPLLPEGIRISLKEKDCFLMPVRANGELLGLIFADGGLQCPILRSAQFEGFVRLCRLMMLALERSRNSRTYGAA